MSKECVQKSVHFCSCLFVLENKKRKDEKHGKGTEKKTKNREVVFLGRLRTKQFFVKMAFLRKLGKHDLCSEGKKAHIFVETICFGNVTLFVAI